jgi:hypothetical protein
VPALVIRPLVPEDADAARAVVQSAFRGTSYLSRMMELLDNALGFGDPEYLCLLAERERSPTLAGLVLFGTVIGARRAAKVHAVAADDPRVHLALLGAVRESCERSGERLVVCEIPRDTPFDVASVALAAIGFHEEGRIEHLVREGVAMRLLVWRPGTSEHPSC